MWRGRFMSYELEIWQNSTIWSIKHISVWKPGLSYAILLILTFKFREILFFANNHQFRMISCQRNTVPHRLPKQFKIPNQK